MTPRDFFEKTIAVVAERWPFARADLENDYRRDLWRLMEHATTETSVALLELAKSRAGDQRQFGRPSAKQLWGAALESSRYEVAPTRNAKSDADLADGLDPRQPWNHPGKLMRGMLVWPPGGTARKRIIGYLRDYHKVDASHLLDAPQVRIGLMEREPGADDDLIEDDRVARLKSGARQATEDYLRSKR